MNRVLILLAFLATGLAAPDALAYVGPGAGISAIGALLTLLATIAFAIFGLVWYPIKRLHRSLRQKSARLGQGAESKDGGR